MLDTNIVKLDMVWLY